MQFKDIEREIAFCSPNAESSASLGETLVELSRQETFTLRTYPPGVLITCLIGVCMVKGTGDSAEQMLVADSTYRAPGTVEVEMKAVADSKLRVEPLG